MEGEAFSSGPARAGVEGFEGKQFAGSHIHGYRAEGTLTSPPFLIEKPYINFQLAGGETDPLYVALLVNGQELKTAIPDKLEKMVWTTWDVSYLLGLNAQIRIVDDRSGHPEGFLFVDAISQGDEARASPLATRTLKQDILTAAPLNPDPSAIPSLGVWRKGDEFYVSAMFPNVPGFTCDSWCYEIHDCEFIGAAAREGGVVELEHRITRDEHQFRYSTRVVPTPGAVEFLVKALADPTKAESLPDELPIPNLCFQLRRARGFKSDRTGGDRSRYPEFVKRCFIFTNQGRTFLLDTDRQKIPVQAPTTEENNPPWVQTYIAQGIPYPAFNPNGWAGTSKDRYVFPVIGTVSADGKHLVALADDSAEHMCQAWHDCLHSYPEWKPVKANPAQQRWRLKIYVVENDLDVFLDRIRQDFPELETR